MRRPAPRWGVSTHRPYPAGRPAPGLAGILLALGLAAAAAPAQPIFNTGIVFSEFHHTLSPLVNPQLPPAISYIELLNRNVDPIASPFQIGGAVLRCERVGLAVAATFPIPSGVVIPSTGRLVISSAQIPGIPVFVPGVPQIRQQVIAPTFFNNGIAQNAEPLRPNVPQRLYLLSIPSNPGAISTPDRVDFNAPLPNTAIPNTVFIGQPQLPFVPNTFGQVNRVLYVDSDTHFDWDGGQGGSAPVGPTPGYVEPQAGASPQSQGIGHVNGFIFGQGPSGALANVNPIPWPPPSSTPLQPYFGVGGGHVSPASTVNLNFSSSPCSGISVPHHPWIQVITDPLFDRTLSGGQLQCFAQVSGVDPLLGQDPVNPGFAIPSMIWNLVVPPPATGTTPGILNINMVGMTQRDARFSTAGPNNTPRGGRPRIERIFSDLTQDAGASASGGASGVQIDVVPLSTGGGDIWCDVIIYDENGFSYRAKVLNWPNTPTNCSSDPNNHRLGLGSNAIGNLDLIALCFTKQPTNRELYILPTFVVTSPTGSGAFMGITPDGTTLAALMTPMNTPPFHVATTVDGLYFFSITNAALAGLALDVVAAEFNPGAGFVPIFPTATINIQ